jgi:hypothetical protein
VVLSDDSDSGRVHFEALKARLTVEYARNGFHETFSAEICGEKNLKTFSYLQVVKTLVLWLIEFGSNLPDNFFVDLVSLFSIIVGIILKFNPNALRPNLIHKIDSRARLDDESKMAPQGLYSASFEFKDVQVGGKSEEGKSRKKIFRFFSFVVALSFKSKELAFAVWLSEQSW